MRSATGKVVTRTIDIDQTRHTRAELDVVNEYNNIDLALEEGVVIRAPGNIEKGIQPRYNNQHGKRIKPEDVSIPDMFDLYGNPLTAVQVSVYRAAVAKEVAMHVALAQVEGRSLTDSDIHEITNQVRSTFIMPTTAEVTAATSDRRQALLDRRNSVGISRDHFEVVTFACSDNPNDPKSPKHTGEVDLSKYANSPVLRNDRIAFFARAGLCPVCRKQRDGIDCELWELDYSVATNTIFADLKFRHAINDATNPNKSQEMLWWAMQNRQVVLLACRSATDIVGMPEYEAFEARALACEDAGAWTAANDDIRWVTGVRVCDNPLMHMQRAVEVYEMDNPDLEPIAKLYTI